MAALYELTEEFHALMQMAEEQNLTQKDIEDTLEGIEYEIEEKSGGLCNGHSLPGRGC